MAEAVKNVGPGAYNGVWGDICAIATRIEEARGVLTPLRHVSWLLVTLDLLRNTNREVNALFTNTARAQRERPFPPLGDNNREIWRSAAYAGLGSSSATVEKIDDGALSFGKPYELNAGPDDAVRSRSCISHLARDRHIDGGTECKAHRNATTQMQSELTVLPHTEKLYWVGMAKVYPQTKRRNVDHRAFPPQVSRLVLDVAKAYPKGRLAICPSTILHGLSSQ